MYDQDPVDTLVFVTPLSHFLFVLVQLWSQAFNQDISNWDVSKLMYFGATFMGAEVCMIKIL